MTKNFKLVMALLLAAMMLLSVVAFAAGETESYGKTSNQTFTITITPTAGDNGTHTYSAYQVFAGDLKEDVATSTSDGVTTHTNRVLSNISWGAGVNETNLVAAIKTADILGFTASSTDVTAAKVAEALADATYANDVVKFSDLVGLNLNTAATLAASSVSTITGNQTATLVVTNPGYYFVKDTVTSDTEATRPAALTDYILQVVSDVTVKAKSSVPAVEKKVKEDSYTASPNKSEIATDVDLGTGFNDVADYQIGDEIDFEILGTLPANYADFSVYAYKFTDTLSTGLTYKPNSMKVEYTNNNGTDWTEINQVSEATKGKAVFTVSGQELTVDFPINPTTSNAESYTLKGLKDIEAITASTVIRLTYKATLNKNAEIGLPGNDNKVKITYSNNPNKGGEGSTSDTPEDKVIVFTYEFDSTKYHDNTNTGSELNGAKFVLKNTTTGSANLNKYVAVDATTGAITWVVEPTLTGLNINTDAYVNAFTAAGITVFESQTVSTKNGIIGPIKGLDDGTYTLVEILAPAGYNLTDTEISATATLATGHSWDSYEAKDALTKFSYTIDDNEPVHETYTSGNDDIDGIAKANIVDNSGATLPSTGGIGTTIFYVAGSILVLAAAILLITKRRMGNVD